MKRRWACGLLLACLLYGADNSPAQREKPYVLLIGLDGFRFDYPERYGARNLEAFREQGSSSAALIPQYPSLTFPNFYSLATGLLPEHHGIVANRFWDPSRGAGFDFHRNGGDGSWYDGVPIWEVAERRGMRTAAYFWPGTDAEIHHIRPTYYFAYDVKTGHEQRVKQALEWLHMPEAERPHLVILYFDDADVAGHRHGPDSEEERAAVRKVDASLGDLFAGLKTVSPTVNVVIVSDHGMLRVERAVDVSGDADFSGFHVESDGPMLMLYSGDRELVERTYRTLHNKSKLYRVYRRAGTPREWHYADNPRIGDLLLVANGPYVLTTRAGTPPLGMHGYDPQAFPLMRGIFYARGPRIRRELRLPPISNLDVFRLLTSLLGLKPPANLDGGDELARKLYCAECR